MYDILIQYFPYMLLGFAIGYMVTLGATGGPDSLEQKKHNIEIKKERFRMLDQKK